MRTIAAAALAVLLAACDSGAGRPVPTPPPSPSPSPTLSVEQQQLARLALAAARLRYDATYAFEATATRAVGTLRIVAAPTSYRVDITNKGTTSIFITTPQRTVSCSNTPTGRKSCFLVARAGEEVPDLFDPGVQRLFSAAVGDMARNPMDYVVTAAPPVRLGARLPAGTCFQVARASLPAGEDPVGFETGRYCFAPNGLLVMLAVSTGRITLRRIGPPPTAALFAPIAPVATLPSLSPGGSPSPSPSRSPSPSPSRS